MMISATSNKRNKNFEIARAPTVPHNTKARTMMNARLIISPTYMFAGDAQEPLWVVAPILLPAFAEFKVNLGAMFTCIGMT